MFSDTSDCSGLKKGKDALKLKKEQEPLERQSGAHDDVVEDLTAMAEESLKPQMSINDHFQCKCVFNKLMLYTSMSTSLQKVPGRCPMV